jgi:biopolymer transport protein ExbD
MGKFSKKKDSGTPAISTASLPDIVFMLLFFFMVATVMRENGEKKVMVRIPSADQVKKIEKKGLVSFIYVGKPIPKYQAKYGTEPRIQLNDAFADVTEVGPFVLKEKEAKREEEKPLMITSIKADEDVGMGIITDIKEELRKVNALKVNYSTKKGSVLDNQKR